MSKKAIKGLICLHSTTNYHNMGLVQIGTATRERNCISPSPDHVSMMSIVHYQKQTHFFGIQHKNKKTNNIKQQHFSCSEQTPTDADAPTELPHSQSASPPAKNHQRCWTAWRDHSLKWSVFFRPWHVTVERS